jgi:hypothetical protein
MNRSPENRLLDAIFGNKAHTIASDREMVASLLEGNAEHLFSAVSKGLLELRHPRTSAVIPLTADAMQALDLQDLTMGDLCWIVTEKGYRALGAH